MTLLNLFFVAIVQGITEFLPISSSGHLILIPFLTEWPDQGLLIDVAVHIGTLGAVLIYFWRDTVGLFLAMFGSLGVSSFKERIEGTIYIQLFWTLVLATIPVVIAGFSLVFFDIIDILRSPEVIGWTSIIFGLLLYWVDQKTPEILNLEKITLKRGLVIGLAQILSLIPGTSRAGITMTAARGLGFSRVVAARFSMLLAIPTIIAAGFLTTLKLLEEGLEEGQLLDIFYAASLSFIAALLAIHFLMKWLTHASMTVFVIYRVILGLGLLMWVYI
ncbi:MAG: undecaprenyl-diphosphate phosphatase [Sphingomonadales bacterium]